MTAWTGALTALVAVRVAIPLVALAASGSSLPGLPRYEYGPFTGDAPAYYSTARELISGFRGLGAVGLAVLLVVVALGLGAGARAWTRRPGRRAWVLVAVALLVWSAFPLALSRARRQVG